MINKLIIASISTAVFLTSVSPILAHVTVQPNEVVTAARQDFSVGVPNEKDIPTTNVRLVIPEGLESVTPYVKPGWTITMKETGEGETAKVTEINWSSGEIGKGLRDSFVFRAMTPTEPTTLTWKAYQTYSDGTVVSWDQEGSENGQEEESETSGPQSETKVVTDLSSEPAIEKSVSEQIAPMVSYVALLLSAFSLALILRKKTT